MINISILQNYKTFSVFFPIVIVLSLMLTCGKDKIIETPPGRVFGVVTDSLNSAPIESAAVYPYDTHSAPAFTDSIGYYAIPLLPHAGIDIICLKTGFIDKTSRCNIVSSESTRVDFQIAPIIK